MYSQTLTLTPTPTPSLCKPIRFNPPIQRLFLAPLTNTMLHLRIPRRPIDFPSPWLTFAPPRPQPHIMALCMLNWSAVPAPGNLIDMARRLVNKILVRYAWVQLRPDHIISNSSDALRGSSARFAAAQRSTHQG